MCLNVLLWGQIYKQKLDEQKYFWEQEDPAWAAGIFSFKQKLKRMETNTSEFTFWGDVEEYRGTN